MNVIPLSGFIVNESPSQSDPDQISSKELLSFMVAQAMSDGNLDYSRTLINLGLAFIAVGGRREFVSVEATDTGMALIVTGDEQPLETILCSLDNAPPVTVLVAVIHDNSAYAYVWEVSKCKASPFSVDDLVDFGYERLKDAGAEYGFFESMEMSLTFHASRTPSAQDLRLYMEIASEG